MADVLLQTKLYRPTRSLAQRPSLIPRTHLSHKLQSGLPGKLTLVSAPAGFGKTTMVVTWLDELADDQTRIGWLSLDDKDNDPVRFLSYFVAALQTAVHQLGQTAATSHHPLSLPV
jgi:LuxR family maltose regulon positive regulatory protein